MRLILIPIACFSGVIALAAFMWNKPLGHDVSWFLVSVPKWLNGAELYRDIVEVNPPLIFYIMVPPVRLAEMTGLSGSQGVLLFVLALTLISFRLTWQIIDNAAIAPLQKLGLMLGTGVALLTLPLESFGQREHFLLIFALPYFISACLSPAGSQGARHPVIVLFALPGLLLKPFFLLVPLSLVVTEALEQRNPRAVRAPILIALVISGSLYMAAVWIFHRPYLTETIPLGQQVYWAYSIHWVHVVKDPILPVIAVILLTAVLAQGTGQVRQIQRRLLVCVLGFALVYAVQGKGFAHHTLPMEAAAALLAGWLLGCIAHSRLGRAIGAVALSLLAGLSIQHGPYDDNITPALQPQFADGGRGQKVAILSAHLSHAFPMINKTGAIWISRYPALWTLPGAWRMAAGDTRHEEDRATGKRVLRETLRAIVDDLTSGQPDYVVIDARPRKSYFFGHRFDYITFRSQDQRFEAFWSNYQLQDSVDFLEIYRRAP